MSDQSQLPEMEPEQAAELAALERMAAQQEAQTTDAQATEPIHEPIALAAEISGLLAMMVGLAKPMFPSLALVYTPEAIERVGEALEPVCVKRGWLTNGIGGAYSEELFAVFTVAPLAFATYKAVQSDIAASKPPKQIEQQIPLGQQPGATPDIPSESTGLVFGEVQPHENN